MTYFCISQKALRETYPNFVCKLKKCTVKWGEVGQCVGSGTSAPNFFCMPAPSSGLAKNLVVKRFSEALAIGFLVV